MVSRLFLVALLGFSILLPSFSQAGGFDELTQDQKDYVVKHRQQMLDLFQQIPPPRRFAIKNITKADPRAQELLKRYAANVWPFLELIRIYDVKSWTYRVMSDRGLALTPEENDGWRKQKVALAKMKIALQNDPQLTAEIKAIALEAKKLRAEGAMKGEFADFLANQGDEIELTTFDPGTEGFELQQSLVDLEDQISKISNESPYGSEMPRMEAAIDVAREKLQSGKIDWGQASADIKEAIATGSTAKGHDVATRAREQLNEAAIQRSKIAKIKGFENHAEYALAIQAREYGEGFVTVAERLQFLRQMHRDFKPLYERGVNLVKETFQVPERFELKHYHRYLMELPGAAQIREYFPNDRLDEFWAQALKDSGVPQEFFDSVTVDSDKRGNEKQTHAYLIPLIEHMVKVLTVDAANMAVKYPRDGKDAWYKAIQIINQFLTTMNVKNQETAFHEGGHALQHFFDRNPLGVGMAYALVEMPSMSAEYFLQLADFLRTYPVNEKGEHIPEDLIQSFIMSAAINDLIAYQYQIANARFDLELWNYDYSAPGAEKFLDRFERLSNSITSEILELSPPGVIPEASLLRDRPYEEINTAFARLSTGHFWSGQVRYIGYAVAGVASAALHESLMDVMEQETGRRTLVKQPTLIKQWKARYGATPAGLTLSAGVKRWTGKPLTSKVYLDDAQSAMDAYRVTPIICNEVFDDSSTDDPFSKSE